jgi:hypothetical protein
LAEHNLALMLDFVDDRYDPSLRHGETEQCEIRPQEVYRITIE